MRKLNDAPELEKFERRLKSAYGRGQLAFADYQALLSDINQLRKVSLLALTAAKSKNGGK